ncbi:MAG: methionyl-tRNA formyltransferase [Actinobacteria bacterium]|nr:methionyl-tRNA formyltransferase [Actinomycetota bacterium]
MKTVYLGTSDFAATVLRRLADSAHRPVLVVSRPARPKGRGRSMQDPPVAELARELGIEVFQPESVNESDAVARIAEAGAEAIVVCAFGAIVKEPLLSMLPNFNVHPSLLPRWRGAAPVERAIAAGDAQTGVSIMRLVEELDAGPFCAQRAVPIGPDDDYGTLAPILAELGGELLVGAISEFAAGSLKWTDQDDAGGEDAVTYAEKITREDRQLRPMAQTAKQMELTIRALNPHIGAFFETASGEPLRVERACATEEFVQAGVAAGREGHLLVGAAEGALELLGVKPAGGKSMDAAGYLRGYPVPELKA